MSVEGTRDETTNEILDLREEAVDPATVLSAIRDPDDDHIGTATPTGLHDRVGFVHTGMTLALRPALAEAIRTRRVASPVDRELATAERRHAGIDVPAVDLVTPRASVAAASADTQELRERVARLGGRVSALRETNDPTLESARAELDNAVTELAEAETERVAAEQRLARARDEARDARDRQERLLRLEDRVDNVRREARRHLVTTGWPAFRAAVDRMPVRVKVGERPDTWEGPDWVAALGVIAVAELRAPIVVTDEAPTALARPELLGVPVVRV